MRIRALVAIGCPLILSVSSSADGEKGPRSRFSSWMAGDVQGAASAFYLSG